MLRRSFQRRLPVAALVLIAAALLATQFAGASSSPAPPGPQGLAVANVAQLQAQASFADNAGKVDGFKASSSPRPSQLLALGRNRKFPASVLPASATGPRGPTGPPGPPGPNGAITDTLTINPQVFTNSDKPAIPASGSAICSKPGRVVGGGYIDETAPHPGSVDEIVQDSPIVQSDLSSGWFVQMTNVPQPLGAGGGAGPGQVPVRFQVYVLCLS